MLEAQRAGRGTDTGPREHRDVATGARCAEAHVFPDLLGEGALQPRTCFGFISTFALGFLMETLQTG